MERKLWFKIFALLLLALSALASHGNETSSLSSVAPQTVAGPSSALAPVTPTAGPESGPSLNGQVDVSNNNTEPSPTSALNSTTEEELTPLEPLDTSNGTTVTSSSGILDINGTIIENGTSLPASQNQTPTTQSQLAATSTTLSSTSKSVTLPVPLPTSASHLEINNTSQSHAPNQTDSVTPTAKLNLSTSIPATTTSTTTTPTTTATASSSTKSSAQESIQATSAVSHKANNPSQLNVGEDTTVVHETPALDPLLAGLVSAFIIAAVIITLLLFLKLRRRDSRPEFRRLQDLPMDDMMEDTPLSMYSY